MRFEFATADRIIFGRGVIERLGPLAKGLGSRPLAVIGLEMARAMPALDILDALDLRPVVFAVAGEPTTQMVQSALTLALSEGCDCVVSFGGGSAIDTGKAVAALLTNGGDPLDYVEVIGRGLTITKRAAPHIAIPTTAGTGAEVTANAVLASPEHRVKVSMRSPLMIPSVALVDPELTHGLPPAVTAATGLDALTQIIEPFVSNRANPLTDALCREGLARVARSLREAFRHGNNSDAREDMALASLIGGLALANAGLGIVHGFAGPIGGMFHAPHGAVCGRLLPFALAVNVEALRARAPHSEALRRYDEIARIVTGRPDAAAADGIAWVEELCAELAVPPLSSYGITADDLPMLVEKAAVATSTQKNPIPLTPDEMLAIVQKAL
jgi:alcohol dehydrogenase class IV